MNGDELTVAPLPHHVDETGNGRMEGVPGPNSITPLERFESAREMSPPHHSPPLKPRTTLEDQNIYMLLRWSPTQAAGAVKTFQLSGDTIYCERTTGAAACYIKLGSGSNPWIRLRAGRTYKRKFSSISLRMADSASFQVLPEVVLYVSTGAFIEDTRPPKLGLDANTLSDSAQVATTVAQSFLGTFQTGFDTFTVGASGGVLFIKNIDAANDLFLVGASAAGTGFKLAPGETFSCLLDSKLAVGTNPNGLKVQTSVGTCQYSFLVSGLEQDQFDVTVGLDAGGISA